MSKNRGFIPIAIAILVVGILVIGGGLGYIYVTSKPKPVQQNSVVPKSDDVQKRTSIQTPAPAEIPPTTKPKAVAQTKPSLENTLEYKYYGPGIPFSFRYPQDYCWTQDIAAVVIHKPPFCGGNNAVNVKGSELVVFAFPEETIKTTEEYLTTERLRSLSRTGEKRTIGGYTAIKLADEKNPTAIIYAFLTNYEFKFPENLQVPSEMQEQHYKYGVVIQTTLHNESGGKEAEELILSTFTFQPLFIAKAGIEFVLADSYQIGEGIDIKIKNTSSMVYLYEAGSPACALTFFDHSRKRIIIPEGTHCDIAYRKEIKPGETVTLLKWGLTICLEGGFMTCNKSQLLTPGLYFITGNFSTKDGSKIDKIEKQINVKE